MEHKTFSIEVPLGESKSARPFLYKFDKELEARGYKKIEERVISDNPQPLPGAFIRTTETSKIMVSDRAYLTVKTQQLIQQEKGETYHAAGITGNISVCEEKDLKEFKKIVESVFNIKNLKLSEI